MNYMKCKVLSSMEKKKKTKKERLKNNLCNVNEVIKYNKKFTILLNALDALIIQDRRLKMTHKG